MEMLELCLAFGADVTQIDEKGSTALDQAIADNNQPVIDRLQEFINK